MEIAPQRIADWSSLGTSETRKFPEECVEQGIKILNDWSNFFPHEDTWVRKELGIPSVLVRFDCVHNKNGLFVYEIEDKPMGVGIVLGFLKNEEFAKRLESVQKTWPDFKIVISPKRTRRGDDYLWRPIIAPHEWAGEYVLTRAEPQEDDFHQFETHAISPIKREGDKSYGIHLGWWREVSSPCEIDWDKPFVLKPLQGTRMKDIEIFHPGKRGKEGFSTRTRTERVLKANGTMYHQQYVPPLESGIEKYRHMIFRVYFGFDATKHQWKYLTGAWNARSCVRIHGASDTLFGVAI